MKNSYNYEELLSFCNGAHLNKDIIGWQTLHEFENSSNNKDFDAKVYKKGNRIVISFAGSKMNSNNDLRNDLNIMYRPNVIPAQYGNAERLYNKVKTKYPNAQIESMGYSLGASLSNLLSHRTGIKSTVLAPIGSKNIAKIYPQYFKYGDENITTFGRIGDPLFMRNINKQSGNIIILPDLKQKKFGIPINIKNHDLATYQTQHIHNSTYFHTGKPTGFAAPVTFSDHIFTPQEIGAMTPKEFKQNESVIMRQMQNGQIQNLRPTINLTGFQNPLNKSKQIFSREDIGAMTVDEYSRNEKVINAQMNSIGIPANQELRIAAVSGDVIYVEPYVRSDGTPVKGYYRSR